MTTKKKGFTLIELLVVIVIIAILAAIIFPVYKKAKAKAVESRCISNARQIGLALAMYRGEFDGYSVAAWNPAADGPSQVCGNTGYYWFDALMPYAQTTNLLAHNPQKGTEQVCSVIIIPKGASLLALNNVVHQRNRFANPGWIPVAGWQTVSADYFTTRDTKDGKKGSQGQWAMTMHESQVNSPDTLISLAENRRALGLQPASFLYRGSYHRAFSARFHASPTGMNDHNGTSVVIYFDGHIQPDRCGMYGGALSEPRKWNNSPNADGGGWNRNRSGDPSDDIYHGLTDPKPAGAFTGWLPIDQLFLDVSLGGTDDVLHDWYISHLYGVWDSIWDDDLSFGDYNTVERPDVKYDE